MNDANALVIRPVDDDDYTEIAQLYSAYEVIGNTSQVPHRTAEFWRDYRAKRGESAIALAAVLEGRIVGHMTICPDDRPRRRHTAWFGIAVHVNYHRRGIGRALMHELIRLADDWLNLTKIELGVLADNTGGIALYREFGFVEEGRLRKDLFKDGGYVDTILMARFRPDSPDQDSGGKP